MKRIFFRLALAATALLPVSSALAADLVDEIRPSSFDWSGPYLGALIGIAAVEGDYVPTPFCGCPGVDPEMSGNGYHAGVLVGWNYQWNHMVLGVEGDYAWGGEIADNEDPSELTYLKFNDIATLRARAGWADGNSLLYLTGGAAFVNTEFGGDVGLIAEDTSDDKWLTGWTIGGGIEHAFAGGFAGRLEYLYVDLPDKDYTLRNSAGEGGVVSMNYDSIHMVRAALTYNFGW